MKKIYSFAIAVALVALTAIPAYAAKPTDLPEKSNSKATEAQSKNQNKNMEKVKPISKFWFYPEIEDTTEYYDYEMEPWGRALVNSKKGTVMYIGHNHVMDDTYYLYNGDISIGEGIANEDGLVKIKVEIDVEDIGTLSIRTVEAETILISRIDHLKGLDHMEEM